MNTVSTELQEKALIAGDLAKLTPDERLSYYGAICDSLGLNPLTRPFEYITLNGKLTLYARKDCTEQLRSNRSISVRIISRETIEGVYIVTVQASHHERVDESTGAVTVKGLQGDALANAMMKAETKAKRRVTLSFCGLGMLDESEVDSLPPSAVSRQMNQERMKQLQEHVAQDGAGQPEEGVTQEARDAAPPLNEEESLLADLRQTLREASTSQEVNKIWAAMPDSDLKRQCYDVYREALKALKGK